MWNLMNKVNKQTTLEQTHKYREETNCCQRERVWGMGEKGERIKNYKLVVIK